MREKRLSKGAYGVKLVRGPFVELEPHPQHCETKGELRQLVADLRASDPDVVLAADLFAGAGGLSLGLAEAGMRVVLSADHYQDAVRTHVHHFPGMSVDWDLSDVSRVEEIAALIKELRIDVLAGGPPCQPFSKAGRSGIRYRVEHGLRDPHDERRDLWRAFLEVVRLAGPRAVIMENVPDMALDREMFILRAMVGELENLGYAVEEKVVETWRYGVPQFRQRLIMVALRDGLAFEWPHEVGRRTTVWEAIGDLPPVEGGFRPEGGAQGYQDYPGSRTSFQQEMRRGVPENEAGRVYDHITRPVREDDAEAFAAMDSKTRYSELAPEFRRYRHDIFDDKYKRLDEDDLSRTITAHIAKDGYWYIHPRQHRTITVREAARLQTFPDYYRFNGPPSAAFKQIGNAVPPLLARALGGAVLSSLARAEKSDLNTHQLSGRLAAWYDDLKTTRLPWLSSGSAWNVLLAETLLDRADPARISAVWPLIRSLSTPEDAMRSSSALLRLGDLTGRRIKMEGVLELAKKAIEAKARDTDIWLMEQSAVGTALRELMMLVVHKDEGLVDAEPVLATKGVLRPVARYWGTDVDKVNTRTDGRLSVARMVGTEPTSQKAHLALIEIAQGVCSPERPACLRCPLQAECVEAADLAYGGQLF